MNIDNVASESIVIPPTEQIWPTIFRHQSDLVKKYVDIERRNGFYHPPYDGTLSIDDAKDQAWLKDMFWRVTEEIGEACESMPFSFNNWKSKWDSDANLRHFMEELADALHFLTEASLYIGFTGHDISAWWHTMQWNESLKIDENTQRCRAECFNIVYNLTLAANCLKNKPWKTTHMQTDRARFIAAMKLTWYSFHALWDALGVGLEDVYLLYTKKCEVNKFRQNTNY
jgi:hypothetical protein